ncbi:MAG: 50S ribosomal protein L22 [Desulfovibrio sp.]|jgi:large subunit ribosomal protein L22|nr:50S ribosomal protein L22 [Desulfovibrio sp.]
MKFTSVAKYLRVSPQKTRLVADNIRGLIAEDALSLLRVTFTKPAAALLKVVKSAVANADEAKADLDSLVVGEVRVDEGPSWKRFLPRAQGRANRITKRTSHITVTLVEE